MRGHLQCRDTLAGNEGCPLKTGTTVLGIRTNDVYCYFSFLVAFSKINVGFVIAVIFQF